MDWSNPNTFTGIRQLLGPIAHPTQASPSIQQLPAQQMWYMAQQTQPLQTTIPVQPSAQTHTIIQTQSPPSSGSPPATAALPPSDAQIAQAAEWVNLAQRRKSTPPATASPPSSLLPPPPENVQQPRQMGTAKHSNRVSLTIVTPPTQHSVSTSAPPSPTSNVTITVNTALTSSRTPSPTPVAKNSSSRNTVSDTKLLDLEFVAQSSTEKRTSPLPLESVSQVKIIPPADAHRTRKTSNSNTLASKQTGTSTTELNKRTSTIENIQQRIPEDTVPSEQKVPSSQPSVLAPTTAIPIAIPAPVKANQTRSAVIKNDAKLVDLGFVIPNTDEQKRAPAQEVSHSPRKPDELVEQKVKLPATKTGLKDSHQLANTVPLTNIDSTIKVKPAQKLTPPPTTGQIRHRAPSTAAPSTVDCSTKVENRGRKLSDPPRPSPPLHPDPTPASIMPAKDVGRNCPVATKAPVSKSLTYVSATTSKSNVLPKPPLHNGTNHSLRKLPARPDTSKALFVISTQIFYTFRAIKDELDRIKKSNLQIALRISGQAPKPMEPNVPTPPKEIPKEVECPICHFTFPSQRVLGDLSVSVVFLTSKAVHIDDWHPAGSVERTYVKPVTQTSASDQRSEPKFTVSAALSRVSSGEKLPTEKIPTQDVPSLHKEKLSASESPSSLRKSRSSNSLADLAEAFKQMPTNSEISLSSSSSANQKASSVQRPVREKYGKFLTSSRL